MMHKLFGIIETIEEVLPVELIEKGDNSGLLVGDRNQEVTHMRVALEATNEVIDSAIEDGVDLLVVHHPMIFNPIGQITSDTIEGKKILRLITNGIALYAAHSNFDRVQGGLNRAFGELVGLIDISIAEIPTEGYVLKGVLREPMTMKAYIEFMGEKLNLTHLRYVGDANTMISSVGFCTGSGMSFIGDALFEEVDVYLTGDLKYHDAMWIYESGYRVVDVTHFASEIIATDVLYKLLRELVTSDIIISKDTAILNPINVIN